MKKLGFVLVMVCVLSVCAFAAENFTVQNVTGRVERESGGQRVAVKAGDTLDSDTVIHTGVGASVVLKSGEKTYNVPAARNGKVAELVGAAAAVRIGGTVTRTDTDALSRTTGQVGTASARASDAAGQEEIAAE
jgi:hypothetical protein